MTRSAIPNHFSGRIGVARSDVTPPVGIFSRTWGAAQHDVAELVHRRLTLSALTFSSSLRPEPLVLIEGDLSWWQSRPLWKSVQAQLLEALSLDASSLLFALSHTHAAPPLRHAEPDMPGGQLLDAWVERLVETAIDIARQALAGASEATLDWHRGHCALASVRDLPEPNADSQRYVCGYRPDVPADDTLLVGRVVDVAGQLRATLCNYACHPTTLAWENRAISPDYVGAMRAEMERETGVPALFLQGASGDLAPRHQYVADPEVADRHGRQLAFAALATLADMDPPATQLTYRGVVESGAPLAIWRPEPAVGSTDLRAQRVCLDLPLKPWPTAVELEQQWSACGDRALQERIRRRQAVRLAVGDGATFAFPFSLWRLGDTILVGSMAESYSWLQRHLRTRFSERTVVVANLVNGSIGYLPPRDCYDHDIYQVWQTPFARGALEMLAEAMSQSIQRICETP